MVRICPSSAFLYLVKEYTLALFEEDKNHPPINEVIEDSYSSATRRSDSSSME